MVTVIPSYRLSEAKWPLELEELIGRRDAHSKRLALVSGAATFVLLTVLFGNVYVVHWLERDGEPPAWVSISMIVLLFAFLLGNLAFQLWWVRKASLMYGLQCPYCEALLDRNKLMPVTVATGHCGSCGARLVANPPSFTPPS